MENFLLLTKAFTHDTSTIIMAQVIGNIKFKLPQSHHTFNEIEEMFTKNPTVDCIDEDYNGNLYPRYNKSVSDEDYFKDVIICHWRPE